MSHSHHRFSRRAFLGSAGCAALTSTPMLSTLLNMNLLNRVAAQTSGSGDYKAIVCLFLHGGCDSFNLLVPQVGSDEYNHYVKARGGLYSANQGGLALGEADLSPLSVGSGSIPLALHKEMPLLRKLFEQDEAAVNGETDLPAKAAFIANVGTRLNDITRSNNWTSYQPYGLFSHSDQQQQWQTSLRNLREAQGWAGKMQDLIYSTSGVPWAANISMGQVNTLQTGGVTGSGLTGSRPFVLNGTDVEVIKAASRDMDGNAVGGAYGDHYKGWVKKLAGISGDGTIDQSLRDGKQGLLSRVFFDIVNQTVTNSESLRTALTNEAFATEMNKITSVFNSTKKPPLELAFESICRVMVSRSAIPGGPLNRQTFFLSMGGWDHHDEVVNNQAGMLPIVDKSVYLFFKALKAVSLQNNVLLFVCSDFGRTLRSNGRGSDHAWGSNMFVVGGAVKGKQIYGKYPSFVDPTIESSPGHGRLIPTTGVDEYFATLAKWMGVSDSNLPDLFPVLRDYRNDPHTLGFV